MGLSAIASALFPSAASAPAVRRPAFDLQFGSASAKDWRQSVLAIRIESGLAPFVDQAEVVVTATAHSPSAAVGDAGSISLGYQDSSTDKVFTGKVISVRRTLPGRTHIVASTGAAKLASMRLNRSYEQLSAGDILNDLIGTSGVNTDSTEDGVKYSFYVVDDRRNVWQHIALLARKNDYLAWFSTEDKLNFKPFVAGQPVQTFNYGHDILALELTETLPVIGAVTSVGEGAAGSNGQDAWNWLAKDVSSLQAQSGAGDPARLVSDGSLRSADAASKAAEGIVSAAKRARVQGRILVPGAQAINAGSTFAIAQAPQDSLNGTSLAKRVVHRYDKGTGFVSAIFFSNVGAGAGAGGGLLAAVGALL